MDFGCRSVFRCRAEAHRVQESIKALHSVFALNNSHFKCAFGVLCVGFLADLTSLRNFMCLLLFSHCRNVPFVEAITTDVYCLEDAPFTEIKTYTEMCMEMNEQTLSGQLVAEIQTSAYLIGFIFFFLVLLSSELLSV